MHAPLFRLPVIGRFLHGIKLFALKFPWLMPPAVVARAPGRLREFLEEQGDVVVKPLDGCGGQGGFRLRREDPDPVARLDVASRSLAGRRWVAGA